MIFKRRSQISLKNPSTHYKDKNGKEKKYPKQHPNSIAAQKRNFYFGRLTFLENNLKQLFYELQISNIKQCIYILKNLRHIKEKSIPIAFKNPLPVSKKTIKQRKKENDLLKSNN